MANDREDKYRRIFLKHGPEAAWAAELNDLNIDLMAAELERRANIASDSSASVR